MRQPYILGQRNKKMIVAVYVALFYNTFQVYNTTKRSHNS